MAHTRPLPNRVCQICKKKATVEVFNARNAPYGYYCSTCGKRLADLLTQEERGRG